MKTILVDAVYAFFIIGEGIFQEMHQMLEEFPNRKIILTGADEQKMEELGMKNMPYELFTLKNNPPKSDPSYYTTMLKNFNLKAEDVVYFEHNADAIKSAESVGIKTFHYDHDKKDVTSLKTFLVENVGE